MTVLCASPQHGYMLALSGFGALAGATTPGESVIVASASSYLND